MNRILDRLKTLNREWNDLPRRIFWILVLFASFFVAAKLFRYVAPFALAALLAWMIHKPVAVLTRLFGGGKRSRALASVVMVLLVTALLVTAALLLTGRLLQEGKSLIESLPDMIRSVTDSLTQWIQTHNFERFGLNLADFDLEEELVGLLGSLGSDLASLATNAASGIAKGALKTASSLPTAVLFVVLMMMGAFYISADPGAVLNFLRSLLPEGARTRSLQLRAGVVKCVVSQIRAMFVMIVINFVELSVGFSILRLEYAFALAGLIALLDALPVVGAGLFLTPSAIYSFFTGDIKRGVGFLLIYLVIIVMRQVMEPRLISRQLGLNPLATMMAMYAGLRAIGFAGMLIGPLMLLICKVALTVNPDDLEEFNRPLRPLFARVAPKCKK